MLVTSGFPFVSVPVLSKIIVLILCARSSASLFLIRIPACAAFPVPTIIAVGVASPSAHGQAMIRTAMNVPRANDIVSPAKLHHVTNVIMLMQKTVGTK